MKTLFQYVRQHCTEVTTVMATPSWFYNIKEFCDILPPAFTAHLVRLTGQSNSLALWGQFLHRDGSIHIERAHSFLDGVEHAYTVGQLQEAFPLKALAPQDMAIKVFYDFYGIR